MEFTTVQWNIGGGKLRRKGADPALIASYTVDGLPEIIAFLKQRNPDIITLQETHQSKGYNQAKLIAEALGYEHWLHDDWADSHIEPGQRLGQAIVSRHPLAHHDFTLFKNPLFETVWEDGTRQTSHDKGRSRCQVNCGNGQVISVQTLHTTPFRRYNVPLDSPEAKAIFTDMCTQLSTTEPGLIQADFNINSALLQPYFSALFRQGFTELPQSDPTTPDGRRYDHILYKGLRPLESIVYRDVLTDHYPIVSRFQLPET